MLAIQLDSIFNKNKTKNKINKKNKNGMKRHDICSTLQIKKIIFVQDNLTIYIYYLSY